MARDRDADKLRPDTNEIAFRAVQAALGRADKPQPPGSEKKNPKAARRGRKRKASGGGRAQKARSKRSKSTA